MLQVLELWLGTTLVGALARSGPLHRFVAAPGYLVEPGRPTLSQQFIGRTERETVARLAAERGRHILSIGRLPAFFANLLPEGRLRERLAAAHSIAPDDEFALLALTGANLPGALRAMPAPGTPTEVMDWFERFGPTRPRLSPVAPPAPEAFALPGASDKRLYVERAGEFIPAPPGEGDWIARVPAADRPEQVACDFVAAQLAAAAGLAVPETRVVSAQLVDLPEGAPPREDVLMVHRIDRAGGERVHMEDFAQVLGRYPQEKATGEDYATVARLVLGLSAVRVEDALELVRRLVVAVLAGDGGLHLKRLAFGYPDGRHPRLAPAIGISASADAHAPERLGLLLAGERDMTRVTLDTFRDFALRSGLPPKAVAKCVRTTVESARDTWPRILFGAALSVEARRALLGRLARLPLGRAAGG